MTNATYDELKRRLGEIHDLGKIEWLLGWDQQTMMPAGGAAVRAEQVATVTRIAHERFTADETGRLLDDLASYEASLPPESDEASLIRVTRRDWEKARRVPTDLAAETARAAAAGYGAWVAARAASDFSAFLPALERNVDLKRRYVACFPEVAEPYDALLDDYEPGMTAAEVRSVFATVRVGLVPLVMTIAANAGAVDDAPFRGNVAAVDQRRLCEALIRPWGFEPGEWRLDPTHHPFASSLATSDIRLTTRYDDDSLLTAVFGTLHECGHGLYEHGVSKSLERTPLCRGTSLGLHESQSRMWENLVGRSRAFWRFAYPVAKESLPEQFGPYDEEAVYRAANKMRPSLIRVEADEATYCLHIILRFEIEQAIINEEIRLTDLPEVWNAKMREYLGVEVPNDADGVLQDVHWSGGSIGYFPTYALGTILASQIWERIRTEIPDLDEQMAAGQFGELHAWLVDHLYRHGRKFLPKETIELVAGGPLDPAPYLRFLGEKVTSLYGAAA